MTAFLVLLLSSYLFVLDLSAIHVSGFAYLHAPIPRGWEWKTSECAEPVHGNQTKQKSFAITKCGVCGNKLALSKLHTRKSETQTPSSVGVYIQGQVIDVRLWLEDLHNGFLQWRICRNVSSETDNQSCFDEHLLEVIHVETENMTQVDLKGCGVNIKAYSEEEDEFMHIAARVALPKALTCDHCVLQMTYGRTWKNYSNSDAVQEIFRSCSDFRIVSNTHVEFLQNVGLNLCLKPSQNANSSIEFRPCGELKDSENIIMLQPWEEFESRNSSIVFKSNENCLDVHRGKRKAGTAVIHFPCTLKCNQMWSTRRKTDESDEYQLLAKRSGLCLTATLGNTNKPQTTLTQENCNAENENQFWRVVTRKLNLKSSLPVVDI